MSKRTPFCGIFPEEKISW